MPNQRQSFDFRHRITLVAEILAYHAKKVKWSSIGRKKNIRNFASGYPSACSKAFMVIVQICFAHLKLKRRRKDLNLPWQSSDETKHYESNLKFSYKIIRSSSVFSSLTSALVQYQGKGMSTEIFHYNQLRKIWAGSSGLWASEHFRKASSHRCYILRGKSNIYRPSSTRWWKPNHATAGEVLGPKVPSSLYI